MIKSFGSDSTERLFKRERVRQFEAVEQQARRKLAEINAATELKDLAVIPGNRLEKLHGDREGQRSICINDQWRVCFVWKDGDAYDVEITKHYT